MDDIARGARPDDESIGALLSRVVADAEQVARAEIDLRKAKVVARIDEARNAVLLLLASVATGSAAVTALVVGALMILAQRIGPAWASVIVVGALVATAGLCGWLSMRRFKFLFGSGEKLPEVVK